MRESIDWIESVYVTRRYNIIYQPETRLESGWKHSKTLIVAGDMSIVILLVGVAEIKSICAVIIHVACRNYTVAE